jgi:hypothetical protein
MKEPFTYWIVLILDSPVIFKFLFEIFTCLHAGYITLIIAAFNVNPICFSEDLLNNLSVLHYNLSILNRVRRTFECFSCSNKIFGWVISFRVYIIDCDVSISSNSYKLSSLSIVGSRLFFLALLLILLNILSLALLLMYQV